MRLLSLLVLAAAFMTSCEIFGGDRVKGNGRIVTREQNPGSFNSIEAGGSVEVRIQQGAAPSVRIETDENLIEYLDIKTDGNTLVIQTKRGYNLDPSKAVLIYATAPEFKSLEVSGASKLISNGTITGNELEVRASGASDVQMDVKVSRLKSELSGACTLQLRGSATTVSIEASGASKVRCMDLATDETTLDLSGASNAEVRADKQLNIEASGASDVKYRGNANINQKSSGASSVQKVS